MRDVMIVPKDRTMDRKTWKILDRMMRKQSREAKPALEAAYLDYLLYGSGAVSLGLENGDIKVGHLPFARGHG